MLLVLRTLPLPERLLLVIDDSFTKRYGPKVEGADAHHNPTPGPADQPFLYGHVWVAISLALRHPKWGPLALPLRAMLYVRQKTLASIPTERHWQRFATKLQLAARLVEWLAPILKRAGKTAWIVIDGGYVKRPFLGRALKIPKVVIVGRLRKDAALRDLPPKLKRGERRSRGRPRKYGKNKLSIAKRAGQRRGWQTVDCHVYGQQQVRNIWANLAAYNLNLRMHTLVELWAWDRSRQQLCNRSDSPWDDAQRRPSHANRRKALRQHILRNELSTITAAWQLPRKIVRLAKSLMALTA